MACFDFPTWDELFKRDAPNEFEKMYKDLFGMKDVPVIDLSKEVRNARKK